MELEIKKIKKSLPLTVHAQTCPTNCQEKIWAGRTEAEGWQGGCWYTIGYTARGAWW